MGQSSILALSANGAVMVGFGGQGGTAPPCYLDNGGTFSYFGAFDNSDDNETIPYGISPDGSTVVGSDPDGTGNVAFLMVKGSTESLP